VPPRATVPAQRTQRTNVFAAATGDKCVCLSVREDISETTRAFFTKLVVHVTYGRGSVLLRRRCDTLCTSGFVDGIIRERCDCTTRAKSDIYHCFVNYFFLLS